MENAVKEILRRGENKINELRVRAQNLRLDSEELRDENRALKKLQRLQGKEVADMERFVHMTTTTARDIRKDVRDAEESSFSIDTSLRKKNKEIRQLRRKCERYEKLIDMDHKMPGVSELEERLDLAEKCLQDKDKEIETLNEKVKIQEKKTIQVRKKGQRKFAQLDEEVDGTLQECEDLKQRLKDAERKISMNNIYSRKSTIHNAFPAPPMLPALPWHPPVSRQTTSSKVKKWLDDYDNKH
ncbi:lebercilin-like [Actinia tenebrosa]|uniref:Lebercilin-like n=1 Tax=Actinia tenebrosa TaxID=6105 RepID=A0A6P8HAC3_ACTTE|nr:lebercilin-like [Actinia tenebrosa]